VEIVRKVLAREAPLEHDGEEWTLPLPDGLGKPLKLLAKPVSDVPIYLGAIGPKAVEQVGEIADGWLPFLLNPREPDFLLDPLRAGVEKTGRSLEEIDIAPVVPVSIHEDIDEARNLSKPWLAFYLGAMGAKEKNFYVDVAAEYGHGDSAREVQERFLAGDRMGAAAAVTPELIDAACIATTPAGLDETLAAYEAAGVDTLVAVPGGDRAATVRLLAEAVRERVA
jgi:alkanesulfonate monooxygenase SsuD/methylene tetrahydromethanopterin reductase-like flavin-dependent oxidoreductase (luciferase family)